MLFFITSFFVCLLTVAFLVFRVRKRRLYPTEQTAGKVQAQEIEQPKSLVEMAKIFIHDNLHNQEMTMEKVAEICGVSRNYLSSKFKKETGLAFPDYINGLRLEKSKLLLRTTTSTISEIAYKTGYNSAIYFNKVFKEVEKCTPGEYRLKKGTS